MIDIEIIKALQLLRNPVFDWFFFIVTNLGGEWALIILVGFLYWFYDQKYGFKVIVGLTLSTLLTLGLKDVFRRPRPFEVQGISSPDIHGVDTRGYSFPSGHSQIAGAQGFVLFDFYQKYQQKFYKYLTIFVLILIPFSRMYLAQHYLTDVIVGLVLGIFIMHHTFRWFETHEDQAHIYVLYLVPLFLGSLLFINDIDMFKGVGAWIGFVIGHFLNTSHLKTQDALPLRLKLFKFLLGISSVILLKEGLKIILPSTLLFEFFRYFVIGGWASLGVPLILHYVTRNHQKTIS